MMAVVSQALLLGVVAGLSLSPHTIRSAFLWNNRQAKYGFTFLASGLLADISIIMISFMASGSPFALQTLKFSHFREFIFIFYIAWLLHLSWKIIFSNIRLPTIALTSKDFFGLSQKRIVWQGFYFQLINPNPWFFWLTISVLLNSSNRFWIFTPVFLMTMITGKFIYSRHLTQLCANRLLKWIPLGGIALQIGMILLRQF